MSLCIYFLFKTLLKPNILLTIKNTKTMFYTVKNEMKNFKERHGYRNISDEEFKDSYERVSTCFFNWLHDPDVIPMEVFECELDASIFDDMHQDYLNLW